MVLTEVDAKIEHLENLMGALEGGPSEDILGEILQSIDVLQDHPQKFNLSKLTNWSTLIDVKGQKINYRMDSLNKEMKDLDKLIYIKTEKQKVLSRELGVMECNYEKTRKDCQNLVMMMMEVDKEVFKASNTHSEKKKNTITFIN